MDLRAQIAEALYEPPTGPSNMAKLLADDAHQRRVNAVMEVVSAHVDTMAATIEQQRQRIKELEGALSAAHEATDSAGSALAFSPRDWGLDHRDAWLYAILLGWACEDDHEHDDVCEGAAALTEIADRHRWDADTVARVTRHRAAITQLDQISARDTTEEADRG